MVRVWVADYRTVGLSERLKDHRFGPRVVLVVEVQQPTTVTTDAGERLPGKSGSGVLEWSCRNKLLD